jgi:geranylgeranyl diphosphate synthase, type II
MAFAEKEFNKQFESKVRLVNKELARILSRRDLISRELEASMRYSLEGPGKRIRSALVLLCCELTRGKVNRNGLAAAAAIEMVHTYSLIHDDLPAMDDDDYRRGRLTSHKKFDEATAILAGDALLTVAFELLAKEIDEPKVAIRLVKELAEAAGPTGMVAGQMGDMKALKGKANEANLKRIHINKTAKMFACAAVMGGITGSANERQLKSLKTYGLKVGLGFQIADDILDVSATTEQLGKTSGKDARQGKVTYPAIVGLEKSKKLAERLAKEAVEAIKPFGKKAETLRQLVTELLNRTK